MIDILVVIDTGYVKAHYPKQNVDPSKPPVPLPQYAQGIDHNSQFMIAYDPRGLDKKTQGTADLNFYANVDDRVRFRGTSIEQNSDDAVIVYGITYWQKDQVFNKFHVDGVTRGKAVQPNPDQDNGLPAIQGKVNFSSLNATVRQPGTEQFYVFFALYTLASDGQTQELYGYFYWDPTVTVPGPKS